MAPPRRILWQEKPWYWKPHCWSFFLKNWVNYACCVLTFDPDGELKENRWSVGEAGEILTMLRRACLGHNRLPGKAIRGTWKAIRGTCRILSHVWIVFVHFKTKTTASEATKTSDRVSCWEGSQLVRVFCNKLPIRANKKNPDTMTAHIETCMGRTCRNYETRNLE